MTTPDPVLAALLARPIRPRRGKHLSPLTAWVDENFTKLTDPHGRPLYNYDEMHEVCTTYKMKDATGKPITKSALVSAFARVRARRARQPSLPFAPGPATARGAEGLPATYAPPKLLRKE